uniref:BED-type domain-containing protein n=1 Tax=Rhabditophanes sp. KR3021 TaxID=114890 RepID=A0AC35U8R4_9BILA
MGNVRISLRGIKVRIKVKKRILIGSEGNTSVQATIPKIKKESSCLDIDDEDITDLKCEVDMQLSEDEYRENDSQVSEASLTTNFENIRAKRRKKSKYEARCKVNLLCKAVVNYDNGSNQMISHLKKAHVDVYDKLSQKEGKEQSKQTTLVTITSKTYLERCAINSQYFIAVTLQPLSIVESESFLKLVNTCLEENLHLLREGNNKIHGC